MRRFYCAPKEFYVGINSKNRKCGYLFLFIFFIFVSFDYAATVKFKKKEKKKNV